MAFVLINTEIGSEEEVLSKLKKVEGVEEAYCGYGVYDIIAKIKANNTEKLKEIITGKVRKLDKIRFTLTMLITQ